MKTKEILKSGNRMYICESTDTIPSSVQDLIKSPEQYTLFINSVTINPKDVNASLYAQFDKSNLSSFIYAFAIQLNTASHVPEGKQIEMNARRVERLCKKRGINLSEEEQIVINTCQSFSSLTFCYKDQVLLANQLMSKLAQAYL